jgi:hypothetical protein
MNSKASLSMLLKSSLLDQGSSMVSLHTPKITKAANSNMSKANLQGNIYSTHTPSHVQEFVPYGNRTADHMP